MLLMLNRFGTKKFVVRQRRVLAPGKNKDRTKMKRCNNPRLTERVTFIEGTF
jgi:hypothetical protein